MGHGKCLKFTWTEREGLKYNSKFGGEKIYLDLEKLKGRFAVCVKMLLPKQHFEKPFFGANYLEKIEIQCVRAFNVMFGGNLRTLYWWLKQHLLVPTKRRAFSIFLCRLSKNYSQWWRTAYLCDSVVSIVPPVTQPESNAEIMQRKV